MASNASACDLGKLRPEGIASVCVHAEPDRTPIWSFLAEAIARHLPENRDILIASWSLVKQRANLSRFQG